MRRGRRPGAKLVVLALAIAALVLACKKKSAPGDVVEAGVYKEDDADVEAKRALKVVVRVYPLVCDANAALRGWSKCREEARGYTAVQACAERSAREATIALGGLRPSGETYGDCGDDFEKAGVAFLNAAPLLLGDVVRWLKLNSAALIPELAVKPLGDACRDKPQLCAAEPHDYDKAYDAARVSRIDTLECTAKLFRCGQSQASDCWPGNIAPRVGVACAGTPNRSGAGPDDLLYVRATGTPLAR